MSEQVKSYSVTWYPLKQKGSIAINLKSGKRKIFYSSKFKNTTDFQLVWNLLRNEKPVFWEDLEGQLYTGDEPVGDAE